MYCAHYYLCSLVEIVFVYCLEYVCSESGARLLVSDTPDQCHGAPLSQASSLIPGLHG